MRKLFNEIISLLRLDRGTNLKVAALCILAATLFWFFNALNKNYSANVNYPVEFIYDTENYQAVKDLPSDVLLNMTGVGWNLLRKTFKLKVEPVRILLDNPEATKWITGSSLPSAITDQVTDLQLNYVLTDTLYIDIDRVVQKRLSLFLDPGGLELEEGMALGGNIRVEPDSILLTGPGSLINALGDSVELRLDESGIDEAFDEEIEVLLSGQELIVRDPPTVRVSFEVEPIISVQLTLPVEKVDFPPEAALLDSTVVVMVSTRQSMSDDVDTSSFSAVANYGSIDLSDTTIIAEIRVMARDLLGVRYDSTRLKVMIRE